MRRGDLQQPDIYCLGRNERWKDLCPCYDVKKKKRKKLWDYETLESQINNLWSFTTHFLNSTHKLHMKKRDKHKRDFYNKSIKILEDIIYEAKKLQ